MKPHCLMTEIKMLTNRQSIYQGKDGFRHSGAEIEAAKINFYLKISLGDKIIRYYPQRISFS